jgi:hypothetical protein
VELILEWLAIIYGAETAGASASGITALDNEARYETMEDRADVVVVQAVLEEVARCERGLFGEEFEGEIAAGGLEDYFGGSKRKNMLVRAHVQLLWN